MSATTLKYDSAVDQLAHDNWAADPTIQQTWAFPDPQGQIVRLLHVSIASLPPENGALVAYRFGSGESFKFRSEIALISPSDLTRAIGGSLAMPQGWDWSKARKLKG